MYRGSRHLGKIRLHFSAHKVPTSATGVRDTSADMECRTRRQTRRHLVAELGTSKSGGTISQLGCSTSVACHRIPRKQQQQPEKLRQQVPTEWWHLSADLHTTIKKKKPLKLHAADNLLSCGKVPLFTPYFPPFFS
jgi:hypothetical protein